MYECGSAGVFSQIFLFFFARAYFSLFLFILYTTTTIYFSLKRSIHYTLIHKVIENAYMAMTFGSAGVTQIVYGTCALSRLST